MEVRKTTKVVEQMGIEEIEEVNHEIHEIHEKKRIQVSERDTRGSPDDHPSRCDSWSRSIKTNSRSYP
jgi:hypothetical protein